MTHALDTRADASKPYGNVTYADPGYQKDGKARYPLDSEEHCRAAWSYINQAKNAAMYTSAQLAAIKSRIKSALKRYGVDVADDSRALPFDGGKHPRAPKGSPAGGEFTAGNNKGKPPAKPAHHSGTHHGAGGQTHHGNPNAYDPQSNTGPGYGTPNGSPQVHSLQEALNRAGFTDAAGQPLKDDGKLGPKTTAALKKAQKALGLKQDGVMSPALLAALAKHKGGGSMKKRDSGLYAVCVRAFNFDAEPSDGRTLEGYAATFNTPTRVRDLQGDFEETILPKAFTRSLESRTPILQWDHGKDPSVGTAPIGDIQELREDGHGLYVRARLYDHPSVDRVRMAIEGKSVKGMSFRFQVPEGGDDWPERDRREIRDADVFELGPVAFPAYDTTSVSVRSLIAQLDADEHRALLRELAAELRDTDLEDFARRPDRWTAGGGGFDAGAQERDASLLASIQTRLAADGDELRLRGILK